MRPLEQADQAVQDYVEEAWLAREASYLRDYCARFPVKAMKLAHSAVADVVRGGTFAVPTSCARCATTFARHELRGRRSKLVFHHTHGYLPAAWLVGEWLCRPCHGLAHVGWRPGPLAR